MTTSLLVTFDQTQRDAIETALINEGLRSAGPDPGVFLNRMEPVGQNERLPIVDILTGKSVESHDEAHLFATHNRLVVIRIFVECPGGAEVSAMLDPVHQCVRRAFLATGRLVAGVQNLIAPAGAEQPEREGEMGVGEFRYTVQQLTRQDDLGAFL